MACEFDKAKSGTKVTFTEIVCTTCWSKIPGLIKTIYLAHVGYPSGRYAVFEIIGSVDCPGCDLHITAVRMECDSDGVVEALFKKVDAEVEV